MHQDVNSKISNGLQDIAKNLEKGIEFHAGEKIGFTLLVHTKERTQYISNCPRQDSVAAIEKMIQYWKSGAPDVKAHDVN